MNEQDIHEMKVTVEDTPEECDCEDIVIELNTGDSGIATFTTDKLSGEFEALILSTEKKVHVKIESELGYEIFEMKEYPANLGDNNTTYINIRTQSWNEDGHKNGFSSDEFHLNERLILSIDGQPNTNVRFIFRME